MVKYRYMDEEHNIILEKIICTDKSRDKKIERDKKICLFKKIKLLSFVL